MTKTESDKRLMRIRIIGVIAFMFEGAFFYCIFKDLWPLAFMLMVALIVCVVAMGILGDVI